MPDKYTLKPSLTEKFKGIIWKIETDDSEPIIGIETRDTAERKAYFSAFNYRTGICLFKEADIEESWHWSLDKVSNGHLYLHSYLHDSNPQRSGIIAFNSKGSIAWQHFNKSLDFITDEGLVVYNPKVHPKKPEVLSFNTGEIISDKPHLIESEERPIILPTVLTEPLLFTLPENLYGPVLHCKFNGKDIVSYHTNNGNNYNQILQIYTDGSLMLDDNLATGIQKLNPEAFFIEGEHLFFIRDSNHEIVGYSL